MRVSEPWRYTWIVFDPTVEFHEWLNDDALRKEFALISTAITVPDTRDAIAVMSDSDNFAALMKSWYSPQSPYSEFHAS